MRVGVLNNLRAGRGRRTTARILAALRDRPDVMHLETSSGRVVGDALAEFAAAGVELLFVNGGDGSVQRVLTHLLRDRSSGYLPRIAPLRGGRTNMAALALGGARDPVRGLRATLDAVRRGTLDARTVERPVLGVDPGDGEPPHHGLFFGAGMLHRAIELTHRVFPTGRSQGVFGAGVVTATLAARAMSGRLGGVLTPDKMQIALDGEPLEPGLNLLVMATTLDRLFLRLRPFWGTEPAPLRVTLIASGARSLFTAAPGIARGRPSARVVPEAGYVSRNVHEAALRMDCGLTLDGELFPPLSGRSVTLRADERVRFVRA